MNKEKRTGNRDELPLVLEVSDIQKIMGVSMTRADEVVDRPEFPALRSGGRIRSSREGFFEWIAKNRV